jgi:hypothetical protein
MFLVDSDPEQEKTFSTLQLNSELRHVQLELVSAHCAVHQLRLRYSMEDLARFGRRDVLRKSAEAAGALHAFYLGINERVAKNDSERPRAPQPTEEQVGQAVQWLCDYLRQQGELYLPQAQPLGVPYRGALRAYFPSSLLADIRIVELRGARVAVPEFFEQARALGYDKLPDIPHMESMTFGDVIAFNETISDRALFHGLVHALQIRILGLERYADLWIRKFLNTRAHFTVPLEVHAFSLASKFLRAEVEEFSVEEHIREWIDQGRYS